MFIQTFEELKSNWKKDLLSGFLVSLIALPLCLGIASASEFPPMMGVVTAIVGGVIVSFFVGSKLTIKGPAAGLIVIVAGCVHDFGGGEEGWRMALGVVVVAGLLQIVLGKLKWARYTEIFPVSSVHGMLAAIGIIIISRQIHLLLGEDPAILKGKSPLELMAMIPHAFTAFNTSILIIGLVSLTILIVMPKLPFKWLKSVPPALVVLVLSIGMAKYFHLNDPDFAQLKPLVNPGELSMNWQVSFAGLSEHTLVFFEYLLMFVLIGSLESLLTVKAIDLSTNATVKSNGNKDLQAVGIGNTVSGIFGGLPMISEVARSSANVMNGGKTRWANFFHGGFLLLYVLVLTPVIKMVPVAALSAMLIFIGLRLASAKEFRHMWSIGKDQFVIFVATMVMCLVTDLLIGVFTGVFIKIILHIVRGMAWKDIFKAVILVQDDQELEGGHIVKAQSSIVFTNILSLKKQLDGITHAGKIQIDVSQSKIVDHSAQKALLEIKQEYQTRGIELEIIGLDAHKRVSDHHLATAYIKHS